MLSNLPPGVSIDDVDPILPGCCANCEAEECPADCKVLDRWEAEHDYCPDLPQEADHADD